ncbi:hypothetical protein PMI09_04898 [Rhizobium sp. CF122]|nr:hypothetical protein PMI09_04898 [Rhizobium sp. CF122]
MSFRAFHEAGATFEHLFEIAIAERIAQIPGNRLPDQPCLELPSFEIILRLVLRLFGNGIENHKHGAPTNRSAFSPANPQNRVNEKTLRHVLRKSFRRANDPCGSTLFGFLNAGDPSSGRRAFNDQRLQVLPFVLTIAVLAVEGFRRWRVFRDEGDHFHAPDAFAGVIRSRFPMTGEVSKTESAEADLT